MKKIIKIQDIIIWILFILSIIIVVWFIVGKSPTFEQTLLTLIITFLFTLGIKIGGFVSKLEFIEIKLTGLEQSFIKLANDFKDHLTSHK